MEATAGRAEIIIAMIDGPVAVGHPDSRLVRRCDADFDPGGTGAHRSRADPINRENGE